jgi:hypothetical protein
MTSKPKQARGADRWTKQLRFDIEFAKRMVLEQGSCANILVVYTRGKAPMILQAPRDLTRDTVAGYLRAVCTAEDAEAFGFISEAWMRIVTRRDRETQAEHDQRAYAVAPSEAENRIEVVIAEIVWRDDDGARRTMHESREIVRDAKGEPVSFRPSPTPLGSGQVESEGRWVDVLTPERPTVEERALARAALKQLAEFGLELREQRKAQ